MSLVIEKLGLQQEPLDTGLNTHDLWLPKFTHCETCSRIQSPFSSFFPLEGLRTFLLESTGG